MSDREVLRYIVRRPGFKDETWSLSSLRSVDECRKYAYYYAAEHIGSRVIVVYAKAVKPRRECYVNFYGDNAGNSVYRNRDACVAYSSAGAETLLMREVRTKK